MEEMPSWQAHLPARLLEASTHPCRIVAPEPQKLAVHIDREPAVIQHRHDRPVAVRAGLSVTGEICLDEVSLMTCRVQGALASGVRRSRSD